MIPSPMNPTCSANLAASLYLDLRVKVFACVHDRVGRGR